MSEQFDQRLLELTKEAGELSLTLFNKTKAELKKDRSVITEADRAISQLVKARLLDLTCQNQHILIDEEDPRHADYLNQSLLDKVEYIWAVDPIDGTRPFANGMPHYGVSISLIRNLQPWLGAVYFPVLNELFFCDGQKSYFIKEPFTEHEVKEEIIPIDEDINLYSIFLCSESFYKEFDWKTNDCHVIIPACAVVDLCWPAIGRACGCLLRSNLWDFAGSWPIFQSAGLELRNFETGEPLKRLNVNNFHGKEKPWKLKEYHILSSEKNFPILKEYLKKNDNGK